MASYEQIKGVLLEEIILFLLRGSGFRTVTEKANDPTLGYSAAGIVVRGRGADHQIDAIADWLVSAPFSHRRRLLVEAKCLALHRRVGLATLRNTVGVLKDVGELWGRRDIHALPRYHYQCAIFSTAPFTREAQRFAFAHDVYLVPLAESAALTPLLSALDEAAHELESAFSRPPDPVRNPWHGTEPFSTKGLRQVLRQILQPVPEIGFVMDERYVASVSRALRLARLYQGTRMGVLGGVLPVFLAQPPQQREPQLPGRIDAVLHRAGHGWQLLTSDRQRVLYTFDVAPELVQLHFASGWEEMRQPLDQTARWQSDLQLFVTGDETVRITSIQLQPSWRADILG